MTDAEQSEHTTFDSSEEEFNHFNFFSDSFLKLFALFDPLLPPYQKFSSYSFGLIL